jgi:hypothetical protein
MKSFSLGLILALISTIAVADASNCVQDASSQYATGLKNNCNRNIVVTYCFSDGYCDAPRGQGRDGRVIGPGQILVISNAQKAYHFHACVAPEFPDGARGCTTK